MSDASGADEFGQTFIRMLLTDVIAALERVSADSSHASRRDLIRTMFAAIEGVAWIYREHICTIAAALEELSPIMQLALSELSYSVTETGKLVSQTRYASLTAMIRLTTNVAQTLSPNIDADFGSGGWSSLQQAIATRNRLTHPKSTTDLAINTHDVDASWAALKWLLTLVTDVMAETIKSQTIALSELRLLVDDLTKGDPKALAEYRAALLAEDE